MVAISQCSMWPARKAYDVANCNFAVDAHFHEILLVLYFPVCWARWRSNAPHRIARYATGVTSTCDNNEIYRCKVQILIIQQ